jgi:ATP-dependent Lhr-like helicase
MESSGPLQAAELASRLHLPEEDVNAALLRLEAEGQVLRGSFTAPAVPEWCDRRLLARIHRLTIGRLRKEIQPVSAAEFMKFLFQWQHVLPGTRLHGDTGLDEIIHQLAGFEAAASAWERYILPARLANYDPELLDRLCLNGSAMWARLSPHPRLSAAPDDERVRRIVPTSVAPVGIFPREHAGWLMQIAAASDRSGLDALLSAVAVDVRGYLREHGASFFADLARGTGHLPSQVEEALWELSAAGVVTADGFDNLRALIDPRRRQGREKARRPRYGTGRWSLLSSQHHAAAQPAEEAARQLLHRYGVVFRDLLARESLSPPWRDLLVQLRRMELRGEVRGGRFVDGFVGEQFALPEAVEALRAARRNEGGKPSQEVRLSAADPLNLAGVILPGPRVPSNPSNHVIFRGGALVGSESESPVEFAGSQVS